MGKRGEEGPGESRVKGVFRQRGSLECAGKVKVPVGVVKGWKRGTEEEHTPRREVLPRVWLLI